MNGLGDKFFPRVIVMFEMKSRSSVEICLVLAGLSVYSSLVYVKSKSDTVAEFKREISHFTLLYVHSQKLELQEILTVRTFFSIEVTW